MSDSDTYPSVTFPKVWLQRPDQSWCDEKIHDDDVEYILAADVVKLARVCKNLVFALDHNYPVGKDSPLRAHARELAARYLPPTDEEE